MRADDLIMVPFTVETLDAECGAPERLGQLLDAEVPVDWPPETLRDAFGWFRDCHRDDPGGDGWYGWYVMFNDGTRPRPVVVASVGSIGRADGEGALEIGYSVLPAYQGRGIGTAMTARFIAWAFGDRTVERIVARTHRENTPSIALLAANGFVRTGAVDDDGHEEFELPRPRYSRGGSGNC